MENDTYEIQSWETMDGRPAWRYVAVEIPNRSAATTKMAEYRERYPTTEFRMTHRNAKANA